MLIPTPLPSFMNKVYSCEIDSIHTSVFNDIDVNTMPMALRWMVHESSCNETCVKPIWHTTPIMPKHDNMFSVWMCLLLHWVYLWVTLRHVQKYVLGMKISLINVLQVVLFHSLDPSLISLIWAPTNGFSRIIWNLVSYCCYIRSISDQIATYFENKSSTFLSAFRRKYGCQSVLGRVCVYEEWRLSLNEGESLGFSAKSRFGLCATRFVNCEISRIRCKPNNLQTAVKLPN